MADPIAEAAVLLRIDDSRLAADIQSAVRKASTGLTLPGATQRNIARGTFGNAYVNEVGNIISGTPRTTTVPDAAQRTLAQKLFGPGFASESGRAIQAGLAGIGGGQLAAQFAFFGPGGAAAATAGAALLVAANAALTLEQNLEILRATGELTDDELERVRDRAIELGSALDLPGITADNAATAITELVKAGLTLEDAMAGAEATLRLAVAAETDVGTAAQLAAAGLTSFNLAGEDAARVADLLAGASIAAQGDIRDMGLALQQSAAVADQAGLSIDQLVGLITLLARQGILGSDAGTSIRTMLLRLVPTTKEAAAEMERLGVQLDETRTIGEQLPGVIEQYRRGLAALPPIQRQAALQQIFGTDAIRSATVAFEAGAQGYRSATEAADRQGAAAELAGARSKGAAGALAELRNEGETAAVVFGGLLLPAIEEVAGGLADFVRISRIAAEQLGRLSGIDLGPFGSLGTVAQRVFLEMFPPTQLPVRIKAVADLFGLIGDETEKSSNRASRAIESLHNLIEDIGLQASAGLQNLRIAENLGITPEELQRIADAASRDGFQAGMTLGRALMDGLAAGITEEEQEAIDAARASLDQIRREGEARIRESIRSARANLESLGDALAGAMGEIIDAGPIGDAIDEINEELDALEERTSRRSLRFNVSQAQIDLREAQQAIAQVGALTPEQRRAQEEFLAPFRQKIADAKAAAKEFDLTEQREELELTRDKAIKAAEEGIQQLVQDFEEGKVSADEFARLLRQRLGPALDLIARENLGLSFERGFLRDVETLVKQAKELQGLLGVPGTEPGTQVVSPRATQAEVNRSIAAALARLADAEEDANTLTKEEKATFDAMLGQLKILVRQFSRGPRTGQDSGTRPPGSPGGP